MIDAEIIDSSQYQACYLFFRACFLIAHEQVIQLTGLPLQNCKVIPRDPVMSAHQGAEKHMPSSLPLKRKHKKRRKAQK